MFVVKKVLTPFLLPPGIFVVLLFIGAAACFTRRRFRPAAWQCFLGLLVWALSAAPLPHALMRGLEADLTPPANPRGDVIILLGGGVLDRVFDLTGTGAPKEEALVRIVTTARLQQRLHLPVIISGGKVYAGIASEARVYRRLLIDLGVPPDRIIVEEDSRDTAENARYSKKICERLGYRAPILLTSAYHMKRALMSFKPYWQTIVPVPAGFKSWQDREYFWHDYLPQSFENSHRALREYLGIVYTRLVMYVT